MIYHKYDPETHISCKPEGTWKPKKKRHGKENEVIHGNVTVSEKENSRNLIDRNETTAENEQNVIVDEVENNKELSEVEQESSEVIVGEKEVREVELRDNNIGNKKMSKNFLRERNILEKEEAFRQLGLCGISSLESARPSNKIKKN